LRAGGVGGAGVGGEGVREAVRVERVMRWTRGRKERRKDAFESYFLSLCRKMQMRRIRLVLFVFSSRAKERRSFVRSIYLSFVLSSHRTSCVSCRVVVSSSCRFISRRFTSPACTRLRGRTRTSPPWRRRGCSARTEANVHR
jgi:hypothetical protein